MDNVCIKNLSICFVLSKSLPSTKKKDYYVNKTSWKRIALQGFLFYVVGNCAKQNKESFAFWWVDVYKAGRNDKMVSFVSPLTLSSV